jgi:hypothetical protein
MIREIPFRKSEKAHPVKMFVERRESRARMLISDAFAPQCPALPCKLGVVGFNCFKLQGLRRTSVETFLQHGTLYCDEIILSNLWILDSMG